MTVQTIATSSAPNDLSPLAASVNTLLAQYKVIVSNTKASARTLGEGARLLARATTIALRALPGDTTGMDAMLTFHKDNVSGVSADPTGMAGASTLDAKTFTIVSTVFTALRYLATKTGRAPDANRCAELTRSAPFGVWYGTKL